MESSLIFDLADGINKFLTLKEVTVVEVSDSYNDFVIVNLNLSADACTCLILVCYLGKVDAVNTVESVNAVLIIFAVSVSAEVEKIIVIVENIGKLVAVSFCKVVCGMM